MILPTLIWAVAVAGSVQDLGAPDDGKGPLALIVSQPGLRPLAYSTLSEHLEHGGYDAVLADSGIAPSQQLVALQQVLDAAKTSERKVLLVAHGYGGQALLQAGVSADVCATALVGVPRHPREAPWHAPYLDATVPMSGVDLSEPGPAVPAPFSSPRMGIPSAWLGRLPAAWGAHMKASLTAPPPALPDGPVWIAVAPLDELAPPETLGTVPNTVSVTRWGMLRGWTHDATFTDLLTDPRPVAHLTRWARSHCNS